MNWNLPCVDLLPGRSIDYARMQAPPITLHSDHTRGSGGSANGSVNLAMRHDGLDPQVDGGPLAARRRQCPRPFTRDSTLCMQLPCADFGPGCMEPDRQTSKGELQQRAFIRTNAPCFAYLHHLEAAGKQFHLFHQFKERAK